MVYFGRDEATKLIKIGFTSREGEDRLQDIQTGCPGQLVLLLQIEGTKRDEAAWHKRFAGARERGEWFRPVPELLLAIAEGKVSQLEAENARLQARLHAENERLAVARAQLGSLSVGLPNSRESIAVALRNIKRMLEGPAELPVQQAVIFGC
jgi:hypothetical protein